MDALRGPSPTPRQLPGPLCPGSPPSLQSSRGWHRPREPRVGLAGGVPGSSPARRSSRQCGWPCGWAWRAPATSTRAWDATSPPHLRGTRAVSNRGQACARRLPLSANHGAVRSRIGPVWGKTNLKPEGSISCAHGGEGEGDTGAMCSDWLR